MRNTTVFGFSMEKRSHRRGLVVAAYTLLAVLAACGWMLDRFRDTGLYIYFAAFFINYYIFGGYGPSGLIRPFSGRAPRAAVPRSLVDVRLNLAGIRTGPEPSDSRNDERELQVPTGHLEERLQDEGRDPRLLGSIAVEGRRARELEREQVVREGRGPGLAEHRRGGDRAPLERRHDRARHVDLARVAVLRRTEVEPPVTWNPRSGFP